MNVVPISTNELLRALPPAALADLQPQARRTYDLAHVLARFGNDAEDLYFPEEGAVISLICELDAGSSVEVGVVGNEGYADVAIGLGASVHPNTMIVQAPGALTVIRASAFRALLPRHPGVATTMLRFCGQYLSQVGQTAACNRMHHLEERLARWLLLFSDRAHSDTDLPLTHDFLSHMLGVRRAGVTIAIGTLVKAGVLIHMRNRITIVNRRLLEECLCECYGALRIHFAAAYDVSLTDAFAQNA